MLIDVGAPQDVYASPLVRAVVLAKWHAFARPELRRQACWFGAYLTVFSAFQVQPQSRTQQLVFASCGCLHLLRCGRMVRT
jgi:hypothetical protein